jgi:6-phosphogluconolactonase
VGAPRAEPWGLYGKELVIMSAIVSSTSQSHHRSRVRVLSSLAILAIAPLVYFAACSSSDDNGGGAPPPGGGGGGGANQFAFVIASAASEVQAYNLDGSGNLAPIAGAIATGVIPHHVDVDRAGRFVYVANHDSPFLSGWRINQDGSLDPINPAPGSPVTGTDPSENQPHSSVIDQTGEYLYVVSGHGASTLRAYKIDTSTGPTRGVPSFIAGQSFSIGTHAHNVTISPNNSFLYVAVEGSGEVHAFSRDTGTGALTAQGVMNGMPTCDAVVVSNDNRFLFASYENAIEVFSIGTNGTLARITPVSAFPTNNVGGGATPHAMAIHPNGQTLYTANLNSNTVSVFRVDTNTGVLTELQSPPLATGAEPNFIGIHPNGSFLFTADAGPDQLSRFAINSDGTLAVPPTAIPAGPGANGIGTTKF